MGEVMNPPFTAGQQAYREGQPISANPFTEKIAEGDKYPGQWANWRAGWINEHSMAKQAERTE